MGMSLLDLTFSLPHNPLNRSINLYFFFMTLSPSVGATSSIFISFCFLFVLYLERRTGRIYQPVIGACLLDATSSAATSVDEFEPRRSSALQRDRPALVSRGCCRCSARRQQEERELRLSDWLKQQQPKGERERYIHYKEEEKTGGEEGEGKNIKNNAHH